MAAHSRRSWRVRTLHTRRRISFPALRGRPPGGPQPPSRSSEPRRYSAGEIVRQSGIYEVYHQNDHRPAHEVVMLADDLFPSCDTCNEAVRFQLLRTAPYIFQDEDFADQQ